MNKNKIFNLFKNKNITFWSEFIWKNTTKLFWIWIDFVELKKYNSGDSLKSIDWKTTAKKNELFSKKYQEDRSLNIFYMVDFWWNLNFWSQDLTKIDFLKKLILKLIKKNIMNNDNIGFINFNNKKYTLINKITSKKIINNFNLNFLWKKNYINGNVFDDLINLNFKNNIFYIFSDNISFDYQKKLLKLSKNNKIIFVNIFDNLELESFNNLYISNWFFKSYYNFLNIYNHKKNINNQIENLYFELSKKNINYWYLINSYETLELF